MARSARLDGATARAELRRRRRGSNVVFATTVGCVLILWWTRWLAAEQMLLAAVAAMAASTWAHFRLWRCPRCGVALNPRQRMDACPRCRLVLEERLVPTLGEELPKGHFWDRSHVRFRMMTDEETLRFAYSAFNARNVEAALATMHPEVAWPNGMEGGTMHGHAAVRAYWTRQWTLVDPHVEPLSFTRLADGRIAVEVRQVVRDREGSVLADQRVTHVYRLEEKQIREMEIVPAVADEG